MSKVLHLFYIQTQNVKQKEKNKKKIIKRYVVHTIITTKIWLSIV